MYKHKNKHNKQLQALTRVLLDAGHDTVVDVLKLHPWKPRGIAFASKKRTKQVMSAQAFADHITDIGPGFAELLRLLASRGDMVPITLRRVFSRAQYAYPLFSKKELYAHIRAQLRSAPESIFDHIEISPYAIHSSGATYKAFLRGTQQGVLITIQDPRAVYALQKNMEALHICLEHTAIHGIVNVLWSDIWEELLMRTRVMSDCTAIGARMEMLSAQCIEQTKVVVPAILWQYTTPRMLVQEHMVLPTIKTVARGQVKGITKAYAARYVIDMAIRLFGMGGVFLLRPELHDMQIGEKNSLVLTDCIETGMLARGDSALFIALVLTLAHKKYGLSARLLLHMHFGDEKNKTRPHLGVRWPEHIAGSISDAMWQFIEACYRDTVRVPLAISMAAESLYYFEHLVTQLHPDVDTISAYKSSIKKYTPEIFGVPKTSSLEKIVNTVISS